MTTTPSIWTVSSIARIASTAAWSAASLSPRPTQRPAPSAPASVTRQSSSARLRSGRAPLLMRESLHPLGRLDADQVQRAGDHDARRRGEAEPERLRLAASEHPVPVVEAVELVGDADRIRRQRVRAAPLRRLRRDVGELDEPLHEVALLRGQRDARL